MRARGDQSIYPAAGFAIVGAFAVLLLITQAIWLRADPVLRVRLSDVGSATTGKEVAPGQENWPLVVIDPGHGGSDPGASGSGFQEKDVVLALARAIRNQLESEGGVRVILTRDDDVYLPHAERYEIARRAGASLFLSLHADSGGEYDSVGGASIYTLSNQASSEAAARFAARENAADLVNGIDLGGQSDDVNGILVDLAQRQTSEQSDAFAQLIRREGEGVLKFHPQTRRYAALRVLRAPDVPSVLFESGFITNAQDAERLTSPQGRKQFAEAMAQAIRIYLASEA
ncbi:N-acetylmuramoyl-L-alanine amidase [Erythrobacter litoralis]|uniref:N-acetylmuramoyl-L-alanine amidase family protein n=1 Tax=Erythrobacter litoralis TaxID=39960 RepID=UPI002435FDC3|nr:N-acetylmuramoyl-L-alanine amidase [Erythrobacter litoralis]MDG6078266.1 N-acetylmuramoyl-L-alanine amidase [Erythrobacter litoralis]